MDVLIISLTAIISVDNKIMNKFNIEKITQITNYILQKNGGIVNYTKLGKLLYLADKECLKRYNYTISDDKFYSLKNGPILSEFYDLIMGRGAKSNQMIWNFLFKKEGYNLKILQENNLDDSKLSEAELEILDYIDEKYKDKDYTYLINDANKSFLYPEWENPGNSNKPLELERVLKFLGKSKEEIDFIINESLEYEEIDKIFEQNCTSAS
jgi:uncharacterized phage-associated protein